MGSAGRRRKKKEEGLVPQEEEDAAKKTPPMPDFKPAESAEFQLGAYSLSGQGRRRHLRNRDCGRRILPQGILPARLAGTQDFQCLFARVLTADSQCVEALLADAGDHLPDFLDHGLGDLLHGFGEPLEGVPDLDNELACQSRHHKCAASRCFVGTRSN